MSHIENKYQRKQKDKEKLRKILKQLKLYRKWWKIERCPYVYDEKIILKYFNNRNFAKGKAFAKKLDHRKIRYAEDLPINQVGRYQEIANNQQIYADY